MKEQASAGGHAVTFSGPDAKSWRLAEGHAVERFSINGGEAIFARLTSSSPIAKEGWDWSSQGLSWVIPKEFNDRTNGHRIEIGVLVRQSASNPTDTVAVLYATSGYGNSGWKSLPLSADFQLKTFVYEFKHVEASEFNPPIVVISSDPAGTGKSVELLGAYVKLLP